MRLLNIYSLELEEFFDRQTPAYLILSHRWQGKEVTYKDFVKGRCKGSPGYNKIIQFCEFAKSLKDFAYFKEATGWDKAQDKADRTGVQWVWIDTCCIDKRSSAELSEAINSMFQWYARSVACVVYLCDVTSTEVDIENGSTDFNASSWFRRGWTLQELLAPSLVIFCNGTWRALGYLDTPREQSPYKWDQLQWSRRRNDDEGFSPNLKKPISEITGIDVAYLGVVRKSQGSIRDASIATRMSWASQRETTRVEDRAYCLLGIFNVQMPLLYGEGDSAFLRLQLQIIQSSNDMSILAWGEDYSPTGLDCLFAPDPSKFAGHTGMEEYRHVFPYSMTNLGLEMRAQAIRFTKDQCLAELSGWAEPQVLHNLQSQWRHSKDVFVIPLSGQAALKRRVMVLKAVERVDGDPKSGAASYRRSCVMRLPDDVVWSKDLEPERTFYIELYPRWADLYRRWGETVPRWE